MEQVNSTQTPTHNNNTTSIRNIQETIPSNTDERPTQENQNEDNEVNKKSRQIINQMRDPAVSTTACFTMFTAGAAAAYLSYQHKYGKSSKFMTAGFTLGVAALGLAEYFSIKAYMRTNNIDKQSWTDFF